MASPALRTERLFELAWPVFVQHAAHSLVMLVDFWFYSQISDETAATVGQLLPILWLGAFVIPVFAGTGVSVASQFMGANQFHKVVPAYMMNLLCSGALGLCFAAGLAFAGGDIGRWMGLDPALNEIATTFLRSMSVYFVFMGVMVAYQAVLSSRGMTHWLMYSALVVAALNLVLDTLFVRGFGWGVQGVVLASVISIATATGMTLWWVHRGLQIRFYLKGVAADMRAVIRPMLRIGISNALEPFSYTLQQIILSAMIIGLGLNAMAANSYAGRAQMFQITFSVALGLGAQILMAHWMGARRFADVDRLYWTLIRRTTLVALVYTTLLWLFADPVLGLFTTDPAVIGVGKTLLFIAIFLEPARAVNIVGGFALKTVGDARFPMVVGMVFIWGILPVVLLLDRTWGLSIAGFWICFATDEIVRAAINLWRWRTGRWKAMGLADSSAKPVAEPAASSATA